MIAHKLTYKTVRPYGYIIDARCAKTRSDGNGWGILFRERSGGWRIAYLVLRSKAMKRLECHDSPETFEPVKGKAIIAMATHKDPDKVSLFVLDKPVVLKKGVWHGVFAVSKEAHIKIVENIKITSKYHTIKASKS